MNTTPSPAIEAKPDSQKFDAELWAELYTLREAVKGPEGYTSWQDAAVDERMKRHAAERTLAAKQEEVDKMREALELAEIAMNHMGDALNNMDAVEPEDLAITEPAFKAVHAILNQGEPK